MCPIPGVGTLNMPPALSFFSHSRLALPAGLRHRLGIGVSVLLHVTAVAVLLSTEGDLIARLAFVLTWGLLNFLWLLLLRRPSIAASLSLIMVVVLILLSQFKQDILIMSANFVDMMLIDVDTVSFLLTAFPHLRWTIAVAAVVVVPLLVLFWWLDPLMMKPHLRTIAGVALRFLSFLINLNLIQQPNNNHRLQEEAIVQW